MLRPSSTPVRTNQARLVACHVGATLLQKNAAVGDRATWTQDVRTNLADTIRALSDLVREMATRPQRAVGDSTGQFAIVLDDQVSAGSTEDPVGDVAFIAASHLRRKAAELDEVIAASGSEDARAGVRLAESLNSCLRHVVKATTTVEPILATTYGLVRRLTADDVRGRSLAVRRAYTQFRCAIGALDAEASEAGAAEQALRALRVDPAARDFRPSDRVEIDALLTRFERARGRTADDALELERWLADVTAFATMLRAVDRREELITHDLEALPEVLAHVEALLAAGRLVLRGHLEKIRGIDVQIEVLLEPGKPIDAERLRVELRRVLSERRQMVGFG